jgi:hypothetical protein
MRKLILLASLVTIAGGAAIAAQPVADPAPKATSGGAVAGRPEPARLPPNRRDPEDRSDSASAGPSTEAGSAVERAPEGATDLGKDADREDEALRKRRSKKR